MYPSHAAAVIHRIWHPSARGDCRAPSAMCRRRNVRGRRRPCCGCVRRHAPNSPVALGQRPDGIFFDGTGRDSAGADVRVSPSGLARRCSRAAKALIASGDSKALLRRPTLSWRRIPASAKRCTAAFVAGKLRPMSADAVATVRTGVPTSLPSSRSSAEFARTGATRSRHDLCNSAAFISKAVASCAARVQAAAKRATQVFRSSVA